MNCSWQCLYSLTKGNKTKPWPCPYANQFLETEHEVCLGLFVKQSHCVFPKRIHCNLSIYQSPHSSPKVRSRFPAGCMMQDWTLHLETDTGVCLRDSHMRSGKGRDYWRNFPFPVIKRQLMENGSGVQAFCPGHNELPGRAQVWCDTPLVAIGWP